MVRHPAAFASSIKLKRWHFDFNHFLRQEELMNGLLAPFADDVRQLAAKNDDLLEQAILQWRCFHHAIRQYQLAPPDWQFVRHEDLSLDPLGGVPRVLQRAGGSVSPPRRGGGPARNGGGGAAPPAGPGGRSAPAARRGTCPTQRPRGWTPAGSRSTAPPTCGTGGGG